MKYTELSSILVTCIVLAGCGSSSSSSDPESQPSDDQPNEDQPASPEPTENQSPAPDTMENQPSPLDSLENGLIGPLGGTGIDGEYAQFNDSPFASIDFSGGYFYLEDFEDQVLEHPGASASVGNFTSIEFGPGLHDSVDADDGAIDGTSLGGEGWFVRVAAIGVTWTFDAGALGGALPTHAGLVWTDGAGEITFEAFDANGESLGTVIGNHDDNSFNGLTIDDRFYGVVNSGGISAIKISEATRSLEMDHLQWGRQ